MTVAHLRDKFHVVCVISNPVRYKSRYELYKKFADHMYGSGVVHLHTIEVQNGERAFAVTNANNPYHYQLRTEDEIWHKENMVNLAVQRFTPRHQDWKYMAWIDADIEFQRHDWVDEAIQLLQVNHVVQLFQNAVDLGPNGEVLKVHNGFIYNYWSDKKFGAGYADWHPGYCWAMTREAFNGVGGLIDRAILGSGDRHMAMALIGKGSESYDRSLTPNYHHMVDAWQRRADQYIKRDVGYMAGSILHHWHGKKRDRRYSDRWKILINNRYDPYVDVYQDWQGLYRLEDNRIELRDDIKKYLRGRNEDSIDAE